MGICRRRRGSEYYARRFTPKIPHVPSTVSGSPSRGTHKSLPSKVSPGIYPRVVDQGHCSGGNRAHSSVLLENVYCSKEKREEKAHFGFVPSEQVDFHSPVQDGNSRENSKANNFSHVGDIGGYNRCLPACSYSSGVPDLFCISSGTQDLCVSGHAIRSNNSSMGFFQGSETHKVFSASSGSNDFLLSGRLSDSCFVVPFSKDSYQMDIGCPGMAGVHSEPREVVSCPSPETGVSGHYVEPSEAFSLSPSGEGGEDPFLMSGGSHFLMANQEGVGEAGRLLKFCNEGPFIGKTLFDSPYQLDEQSYYGGRPGLASPSGLKSEGVLWALVKQGVPGAVCSYEHFRSHSRYYVRCIRPWLVWNPPSLASPGGLVRRGAFFSDRLAGAKSYPRYYFPLCGRVEREFGSSSFGQFHSLGLPSPSGFYSLSRAIPAFQGYFRVLPFSQYFFDPCPYQRSPECACRPRFKKRSNCYRVVFGSTLFFLDLSLVRFLPRGGPFCHSFQYPVAFVCVSIPRQIGHCMGRNVLRLEPIWVSIRISPFGSPPRDGEETAKLPRLRVCPSSIVADSCLVHNSQLEMQAEVPSPSGLSSIPAYVRKAGIDGKCLGSLGLAPLSPKLKGYSGRAVSPAPVQGNRASPSLRLFRLGTISKGLSNQGFGRRAIDLINNDHKPSTRNQYQGVWNKFLNFVNSRSIAHKDINVAVVADFLAFHANTFQRAHSTISVYKCALADPLLLYMGISLDVRAIEKLLRGLYRLRPPPRDGRMPRWSLSIILDYLRGPPFEPLESASWKHLLQKTLVLFLLATGRRISEVSEIHRVARVKGNIVYLRWLQAFSAKWESDRFTAKEPTLSKLAPLRSGDDLLCPVRAWKIFCVKRLNVINRFNNDRFWPISKISLTLVCKKVIRDALRWAGKPLDCPTGPHQFRKVSTSLSRKYFRASEEVLAKKVGSKGINVLRRAYIRDISPVRFACVVACGTIYPNSVPVRKI